MLSSLVVLGLATTVLAHGTVTGIIADGVYYQGINASYVYSDDNPTPVRVSWTPNNPLSSFVGPDDFDSQDIICGKSAIPGQASAPVQAGGIVEFQWSPWPEAHKGPIIDYIANCGGDCRTVRKTSLRWHKIDAVGLINPTPYTVGVWASDVMRASNNSWSSIIPASIAPGNYVIRHETIALHTGAQAYPVCFNLQISGTGTDNLSQGGTYGTELYKPTHPGFLYDMYWNPLPPYPIPGPKLYPGASSALEKRRLFALG